MWFVQRAKEIARNKKERRFLRDAHKMKSDPNALKEELKEVHVCYCMSLYCPAPGSPIFVLLCGVLWTWTEIMAILL